MQVWVKNNFNRFQDHRIAVLLLQAVSPVFLLYCTTEANLQMPGIGYLLII